MRNLKSTKKYLIILSDGNITHDDFQPTVDEDDYISDAIPVSDSYADETDEDADHDEMNELISEN